jgi:hypothetical protein
VLARTILLGFEYFMSTQQSEICESLRSLLAIVDIDATPILTALSLVQREFPAVLAICADDLMQARFRFDATYKSELGDCGATLASRDVNRAALAQMGIPPALIAGFLTDTAKPRYAGESDPFVYVLRIDWNQASALFNTHNGSGLLTAPDHALIDAPLPDVRALQPALPRTPLARPSYLRVGTAADLLPRVDGSDLRTLEIGGRVAFDSLREVLAQSRDLRHLQLHDAGLLTTGVFDEVELPALESLTLATGGWLDGVGCAYIAQWTGLRTLRVGGLDTRNGRLPEVLAELARMPTWERLTELALSIHSSFAPVDAALWDALWTGRQLALERLRLRYLAAPTLQRLWQARFPSLRVLDFSDNNLADALPEALNGAALPALEAIDLRGNNLSGPGLRAFVLARQFPRLERVAMSMSGDEMQDYHDWNGAVVGSGPVPLDERDIEQRFLAGTDVRVVADL